MARSLAERFRAARQAFELGVQLGCTPAEAAQELARRDARARWEEGNRRLAALRNAPLRNAHMPPARPAADDAEPPRWMHFD